MRAPDYIHLVPDALPPDMRGKPYRAVVIIEAPVTADWRDRISTWLVESGCLYMMAWGSDCSLWDDSVDCANIDEFAPGDIPDDRFVMTTWHEGESLGDTLWYCAHTARHPTVALRRVVLVHISPTERKSELLSDYRRARET